MWTSSNFKFDLMLYIIVLSSSNFNNKQTFFAMEKKITFIMEE